MSKTANSIIRSQTWLSISAAVPVDVIKRFKKALIDSEVRPRQAFMAFMYAVGCGDLVLEPKQISRDYHSNGIVSDETGVFDDYRAFIKTPDGKIVNPMPFTNNLIEKL